MHLSRISLPESGVGHDDADPRAFLSELALSSSACQRKWQSIAPNLSGGS